RRRCHDDINLPPNQFSRQSGHPLRMSVGEPLLKRRALTFDVPQLTKTLSEDGMARRVYRDRREVSDTRNLPGLLRLTRERRREEAAGHGTEECSAVHYSIT